MDDDEFLTAVEQSARIGRDDAERATRVTLQTLAERIAAGEARDLAEQLPPRAAAWVATTNAAQRFDLDEFLRRVAGREGVDSEQAERHASAVFAALGRAVSAKELADMAAELPKDFARLLPRGPHVDILPTATFAKRVADRGGLDGDHARAATAAVLETLAERIAGGEVDDLVSRLPVELQEPLKRGRARADGNASPMSLEEFLARVAEREGASRDQAREHTRAVLATLRDAVGDDESGSSSAIRPTGSRRWPRPSGSRCPQGPRAWPGWRSGTPWLPAPSGACGSRAWSRPAPAVTDRRSSSPSSRHPRGYG